MPITSFKYVSRLTLGDLIENLAYIKVVYNRKIVFDDTTNSGETRENFNKFKDLYYDKIVYKMKIKIVEFHHCIIYVKGEK